MIATTEKLVTHDSQGKIARVLEHHHVPPPGPAGLRDVRIPGRGEGRADRAAGSGGFVRRENAPLCRAPNGIEGNHGLPGGARAARRRASARNPRPVALNVPLPQFIQLARAQPAARAAAGVSLCESLPPLGWTVRKRNRGGDYERGSSMITDRALQWAPRRSRSTRWPIPSYLLTASGLTRRIMKVHGQPMPSARPLSSSLLTMASPRYDLLGAFPHWSFIAVIVKLSASPLTRPATEPNGAPSGPCTSPLTFCPVC